jgi:predicted nucleic acid-binding protein
MALVPDASALICLAFDNEEAAFGDSVVDAIQTQGAIAPSILWHELRNVLIVNERRGRISIERSGTFLSLLDQLPILLDPLPAEASVLALARARELSIYDAAYLELALREGLPLATLDAKLRNAATAAGSLVWPPTSS